MGYRLQDKDVTFYPIPGYSPKFHLKYRVFLNNMHGFIFTKEKSPLFVLSLDGVLYVGQMVENGMKGVSAPAKVKTPTKRVSGAERTDAQVDAIAAAAKLKGILGTIPKALGKTAIEEITIDC